MKTSKRKRSSKTEPVVAASDVADAPAAALSAAAAAADRIATEPVIATEAAAVQAAAASEPAADASQSIAAASEPTAAESEPVAVAAEPVVVLAANCSVKDAAALKTSLCAVFNESGAVTLDATAVERVDTATMQLLCSFVRDRSSRNQSVVWRGRSQALHDAVRLLGVGSLLGLEAAKGVAA